MRLNLGCGKDIKEGYTNADWYVYDDRVLRVDLSQLPWLWADNSASEILMLDFLEHFPYAKTETILQEVWRVLDTDGFVDIQVPDFDECSAAIVKPPGVVFMCNNDGTWLTSLNTKCPKCGQSTMSISFAAMNRLYGGQDNPGNFHYTAFTKEMMQHLLEKNGFHNFTFFERNENGETYAQNWNFKVRAYKKEDLW